MSDSGLNKDGNEQFYFFGPGSSYKQYFMMRVLG